MGLIEVIQHVLPSPQAVTPVGVQLGQTLGSVVGDQFHPLEHGVTDQNRQPSPVPDHLVVLAGRGGIQTTPLLGVRSSCSLPLIDQAGINRTDNQPKPGDDILQALVQVLFGNRPVQGPVGIRKVAQEGPLRPGYAIARYVPVEVRGRLNHVAQDGLGVNLIVVGPRHVPAIAVKGLCQRIPHRHGVGHLLEPFHPILIFKPLLFHLLNCHIPGLSLLGLKYLPGILQGGLNHGNEIHIVRRIIGIQQLQGGQKKWRKRLI